MLNGRAMPIGYLISKSLSDVKAELTAFAALIEPWLAKESWTCARIAVKAVRDSVLAPIEAISFMEVRE
jgi:hypothetical protein